jgi:protease IV
MKQASCVLAALLALAACREQQASGDLIDRADEPPSAGAGKLLAFDLSEGVPESTGTHGLFPLPATRTYVGLVRAVERALIDDEATGVFVRLGGTELGWAQSQELGDLFGALRDRGRNVVCHTNSLGNSSSWLLAKGCTRIWLAPAGDADTVGIAAQVVYLKGALDKLDLHADFLHMGKYKSAAEPFTREGPSDEARQSLTETLASIRGAWLEAVRAGRKKETAVSALERGPWSPEEAKEQGLVDAIGYESEALAEARQKAKAGEVQVAFGPESGGSGFNVAELVRVLAGADEATQGRPHIAVVPAQGAISMQAGGLLDSGGITASALSKTVRRLVRDDSVKAVVLRIDSPGGSALASDLLWHELMELRKKKPLIASIGDMAASGGYYLASAANRVVAEPTSIVGSIGVVGGKLVLGRALSNVGVNAVTFPASPEPGAAERAAYMSALTPWDDATRERVQRQMSSVYELFLQRVAAGRKTSVDAVRPHAEGRIWSGAQGKERGLIDEFGGLRRSIALARQLGGLDAQAPIVVEGGAESLLEALLVGEGADAAQLGIALSRMQAARAPLLGAIGRELGPFIGGLNPLLGREPVLTVLPFALVVR